MCCSSWGHKESDTTQQQNINNNKNNCIIWQFKNTDACYSMVDLEKIILHEGSQSKNTTCIIYLKFGKWANPQRKKAEWCLLRAVGCGAGGDLEREGCGVIANVNGFFLREIKMF